MAATLVTKTTKTSDNPAVPFQLAFLDLLGDGTKNGVVHALVNSSGALIDPATSEGISSLITALGSPVQAGATVPVSITGTVSTGLGTVTDTQAAFGASTASLIALAKTIAYNDAPTQGVTALTVGTPGTAGRMLRVNCSVAGNIILTFADSSTDTIAVPIGTTFIKAAVTEVSYPGSGAATVTVANWK